MNIYAQKTKKAIRPVNRQKNIKRITFYDLHNLLRSSNSDLLGSSALKVASIIFAFVVDAFQVLPVMGDV